MSEWLFQEQLQFGNLASRVGLVTLWTYQRRYRHVDPTLYHVMGNLYSEDGVNYIARNILAHPDIRSLVICGSDGILEDTGVRRALLEWRITDPMIPADAVDWLRTHVRLTQCEMPELPALLAAENELATATPGDGRQPATYPFPNTTTATYPSEISGMRVLWSSVYDAWIDVLRHVLRFGLQAGNRKYLLNIVSVVDGDDDQLPSFITRDRADEYAAKFLLPDKEPDVTYTYGNRMLAWGTENLNLVDAAVAKLQADPLSSRCLIDLWDNRIDVNSAEPPCLTQVILNGVGAAGEQSLYLTGFYRSHDLFRAYFLNLYALRRMQHLIAARLGWQVGKLTTISTHAHIYTWDLESAQAAVAAAGRPKCQYDPRGNLAITERDGKLLAILYAPNGQRVAEYHGSPARILRMLLDDDALSQPSHYTYVTEELYKHQMSNIK